ncbi:MAG: PEP/pyruvate-binding domain-containing protein [Sedimentisphaerales bacterium]
MKHNRLIMPLDSIRDSDQSIAGAKAVGLWRLKRLGLPVPDAFCIAANAYRLHIGAASVKAMINNALQSLSRPESFDVAKPLADVRRAIIESPMDDSLAAEIETHYNTLAASRLAVRSSATAEDLPGHSFAGLYDTYLGISSLEDCLIAIKKCWASLWTERAYSYRQKNGFDHSKVEMAVIVQSLIPADVAGVIFTAAPVTGDNNRVVIEACPGLGDALVSGKVSPDRVVLDKRGLNVISRSISAPCIDNQTAQKLAKLAIKAESELGCPQDIEWAIHQGKIFLLQSRPITTIPRAQIWEDRQIWSSFAAKEVLPDVVTPATFWMLGSLEKKIFKPVFDVMCIDKGNIPTYDLIAGRVYFNAGLWTAVIRHFRIVRNLDWNSLAGSEPEMIRMIEKLRNTPTEDLPGIRHNHVRFILRLPLLIAGILRSTRRKSQSILANARKINEKWACLDISGLSAERLADCLMEAVADFPDGIITASNFLYMIHWMAYFPILEMVCSRWIPDEQSCAGRLLAGLGNMEDAEAGLDLWRLAVKVNESSILKELIQSNVKWDVVCEELIKNSSGEEFLTEWNRFMKAHGHHCRGELEIYNRRWFETPDYVLGILRGYLNSVEKSNPLENRRRIAEQREQLVKKCRQKLRNPFKRAVFNYLLVRAQYGSAFRENIKSEAIKLMASIRWILLELGRKLAAGSLIVDNDDVFFLKLEELGQLTRNQSKVDIRQVIAARRADYEKWQSISPPSVIFGRFNPDTYVPADVDAGANLLDGLAVSPGVVSGKARVILRADNSEQVQAGEILIAPFTDPGWTPYFIPAAGIVMEQGGLLSHGAIIAREYGIPAVVNVGNATKIIKTGQTIQVDGDRGVVRILE